jgi:hypothetical protein
VEPVFGQIKQARGFRQFLLRGLAKVQGEWALVCLTYFEVASALLCLTIIQAATRKCRCKTAHLFTVASRPAGASQNPFPTRFINS